MSKQKNDPNIKQGICHSRNCGKKGTIYRCRYCGNFYCKEHIRAKPAGTKIWGKTPEEIEHIEEVFDNPKTHLCIPFIDEWESRQVSGASHRKANLPSKNKQKHVKDKLSLKVPIPSEIFNERKINWKMVVIIFLVMAVVFCAYKIYSDPPKNLSESIGSIFRQEAKNYSTSPRTVNLTYFDYTVYKGLNDYLASIPRDKTSYFWVPTIEGFIKNQLDDKTQRHYLMPLVEKIEQKSSNKQEQAMITIDIVQNIPYDWSDFVNGSIKGRYPYEVLYDDKGVCMEKAGLLAFLLRELGFGVVIFDYPKEDHRAVGIRCNRGNYNTGYCFIESTSPSPIGKIPQTYVGGVDIKDAVPDVIPISEGYSINV